MLHTTGEKGGFGVWRESGMPPPHNCNILPIGGVLLAHKLQNEAFCNPFNEDAKISADFQKPFATPPPSPPQQSVKRAGAGMGGTPRGGSGRCVSAAGHTPLTTPRAKCLRLQLPLMCNTWGSRSPAALRSATTSRIRCDGKNPPRSGRTEHDACRRWQRESMPPNVHHR